MLQKIIFLITLCTLIFFQGKILLPGATMFDFHDITQPARISEFSYNISHFEIPPRIAPHFSHNLGYPVFNYYAPFSYWVTSAIHLLGFDIADALKVSFLLAICIAFVGMFLMLKRFFTFFPSLLGATLYATSPWIAVEIFVRGNIGEVWFIALFPLALYAFIQNTKSNSRFFFVITVLLISATLTVHNVFSLAFLPCAFLFSLILKKPKKNLFALALAMLLSAYFLLPAVLELPLTYAKEIAQKTQYQDHFLCLWQLWKTKIWGFGGSAPGCENDGMSFMLGKIPDILGILGITVFVVQTLLRKKIRFFSVFLFFTSLTILTAYLTLYEASSVWKSFSSVLSLFQFPWRLLAFTLFGLAVMSAYGVSQLKFKIVPFTLIIIAFLSIITNAKYFTKSTMAKSVFLSTTTSSQFISQSVVYYIPEYVPKTVNYNAWLLLNPQSTQAARIKNTVAIPDSRFITLDGKKSTPTKNNPYEAVTITESESVIINIHSFPFWKILVNGKLVETKPTLDSLGRPKLSLQPGEKTIQVKYEQTPLEKTADGITLFSYGILMLLIAKVTLWKKILHILN
ncbi:hypothetical protein HGA88_00755 [Candidatus Roizmanbacteria bacterium]|nr:hypothetical protein [Candidatus Roizmanbacteria bacterium]